MKKTVFLLLAVAVMTLGGCSSDDPVVVDPTPDVPELNESDVPAVPTVAHVRFNGDEKKVLDKYLDLSFELNGHYSEMVAGEGGSYNVSPLSAMMAVSLMANSVEAPQSDALVKMLGFANLDELNALNNKLMSYLPAPELGAVVKLANGVWHSDRFSSADSYRTLMAEKFGAAVVASDFSDKNFADQIDKWIERNTAGMIKKAGISVNPNDVMTCINTMYFAGVWATKFDINATKEATFHGVNGDVTKPMMNRNMMCQYARTEDFEIVRLPFEGDSYEIEILLPAEGIAPAMSAELLTSASFGSMHASMKLCEVDLTLPRIKSEGNVDMHPVLAKMGLPVETMSFAPMGIPATGYIGDIQQITAFELDEEGAKAAAATIMSATSSAPEDTPEKVNMTVDRPFYYVFRNVSAGVIMMMGRVSE